MNVISPMDRAALTSLNSLMAWLYAERSEYEHAGTSG